MVGKRGAEAAAGLPRPAPPIEEDKNENEDSVVHQAEIDDINEQLENLNSIDVVDSVPNPINTV